MRKRNRFLEQFLDLPWWMSLCLAGLVFVCVTYLLPAVMPAGNTASSVADRLSRTGWIFSFPFLVAAVASAVRQWLQKRIADEQKSREAIRANSRPESPSTSSTAKRSST